MTNDEFPMSKEFLSPNDEGKACELAGTIWTFVLRPSFDIHHSDFVIIQSLRASAARNLRITNYDLRAPIADHAA